MTQRPTRLESALKAWRKLERTCTASAEEGRAFLVNEAGELRLLEGRPVLSFTFGRAWQARREVERLAAEAGVEPPPPGVSALYVEWPSVEALTEFFLVTGSMQWSEVKASLLDRFEDVEPKATATITALE